MERKPPVGFIVCGAIVLLGSFMPWGTIRPQMPFSFGPMAVTVTTWNGSLNLLGMSVPNWFAAFCGVAASIVGMLSAAGIWNSAALGIVLPICGIIHSGMSVAIFAAKGKLGLGVLLILGACVAMLVLRFAMKKPAPKAVSSQAQP